VKLALSKVLLGILILSIILFLCIYFFPLPVLRTVLGIPFLLFFPGFVLLAAIVPQREDISTTERVILSFVLSIVADSFIGLILHYTSFGITLDSILVTGTIFVELITTVALIRQALCPKDEQAILEFNMRLTYPSSGIANTAFTVIMALVLTGALATGLYFALVPKSDEAFTQFYIVEQDGGALYSPANLTPGTEATIILGITNHEGRQVNYRVQALIDGANYTEINSITLFNGQQWQEEITIPIESTGEKQVEFLLYKDNETEPYLSSLRLWINTAAVIASQR